MTERKRNKMVGALVRKGRSERRLTLSEAGLQAGCSAGHLLRVETGERPLTRSMFDRLRFAGAIREEICKLMGWDSAAEDAAKDKMK